MGCLIALWNNLLFSILPNFVYILTVLCNKSIINVDVCSVTSEIEMFSRYKSDFFVFCGSNRKSRIDTLRGTVLLAQQEYGKCLKHQLKGLRSYRIIARAKKISKGSQTSLKSSDRTLRELLARAPRALGACTIVLDALQALDESSQ